MDDRYNYNYEDSYLSKEEKVNKIYNEVIEKHNKQQRKTLRIVFPMLGVLYIVMGIIIGLASEIYEICILFSLFGLLFIILGLVITAKIKSKHYTNEEIEKKFSYLGKSGNTGSYILYDARITLLEEEIKELKKTINELERKLK